MKKFVYALTVVTAVSIAGCSGSGAPGASNEASEETSAAVEAGVDGDAAEVADPTAQAATTADGVPGTVEDPGAAEGATAIHEPAFSSPLGSEGRMTRDAFRTLVMGKTTDELIAAVGRPDEVGEYRNGRWLLLTYRDRTIDTLSGKADSFVIVNVEDGRVAQVAF